MHNGERAVRLCCVDACESPHASGGYCWHHHYRWKRYGDPLGQPEPRPPKPPCSVEGCTRSAHTRGYCKGHYQRLWRQGTVVAGTPLERRSPQECSVEGCGRTARSLGYCDAHYQRLRDHGDLNADQPLQQKFGISVEVCEVDGCDGAPRARNMCDKHYMRWSLHRDPNLTLRIRDHDGSCGIDGCERPYLASGMCRYHYTIENDRKHWKRARERGHRRRMAVRAGHISDRDLDRILDGPCLACGAVEDIQIEHLIPISRGGRHSVGNLAPLCAPCNNSKNRLTWAEWKHSARPRALKVFGQAVEPI
jgi:5-methylcytosine-specific restriction endonuclease McrA